MAMQVTYIPSQTGTLLLYVNYSAAYGPAAVPGSPFTPLVDLAPAPQLLSARLDSSLAIIDLAFDQATDQVRR